ncbi:MAG: PDDEXK nuclease domain-containing protein [Legionellaceae bacterium]|nr:PDDEXK nuclease domain-containing protein [Legionellaceae bacterium]
MGSTVAVRFKPEHAGQLNFYLNLVDRYLKTEQDNPTIGLLLCKSRSKVIAEYALKGIEKPIGVSEYQLTKAIPENLKSNLPSIAELEAEFSEENLDDSARTKT